MDAILVVTDIHPEQGRLGDAQKTIAPTLSPYRQCSNRTEPHRRNLEMGAARVRNRQEAPVI